MKTTKLGIAVMALMGAFAQKADPIKTTHKITAPKPKPKSTAVPKGLSLLQQFFQVPCCHRRDYHQGRGLS